MTGRDDINHDPETGMSPDALLAMDFAIGALGRDERRAADLQMRSDPAFRALVEDWQAQLSPLDAEIAPEAPPAAVWAAIEAEVAPMRAAAPERAVAAPVAKQTGLWNSLMLWRGMAFAGVAAALVALMPTAKPPVAPQILVAALAAADGTPLLSAAYDPLRGAVVVTPATTREETGKSVELWVIEGDKLPRSLGIIDLKGPNSHAIPQQRLKGIEPGATLAISIEPQGGSPTGQPTGPVVATGKLTAI
jgi:anti-sigma-K factor RskA